MDGRDEEGVPTLTKAVGQALGREGLAHEALQRRHGEEAGRHVRSAAREEVRPLEAEARYRLLADGPHELGEVTRGVGEGALVIDGAPLEVEGVVRLLVEDVVEVPRPDAVGHEGADHGAGARSYVEIEVVGAEIGERVERGESARLVHAADHAAARQDEGALGGRRGAGERQLLEERPQHMRPHHLSSVAPHEKPVPKATSITRSLSFTRPAITASWRQMATEAPAVLP